MVTASHNDESYDRIKLADLDGGMWPPNQEQQMAHQIANEHETLLPSKEHQSGGVRTAVVHVGQTLDRIRQV
jgi:phosphomannomutase